jgi:hypothetical protein
MKNVGNQLSERPSSKMIGLGANPTDDLAAGVLQCGFTNVPVIEYVTWTTNVPLLDTDIQATFGDEIDVLQTRRRFLVSTTLIPRSS